MSHRATMMPLSDMSSCAPERWVATRVDGGLGWQCSSIAVSSRGRAPGRPPHPRRHRQHHLKPRWSVPSSWVRWRAWRWRAWPGGERR